MILNLNGSQKIAKLQLSACDESLASEARWLQQQESNPEFVQLDMNFFQQHQEQSNGWHANQTFSMVECMRAKITITPGSDAMEPDVRVSRSAKGCRIQRLVSQLRT